MRIEGSGGLDQSEIDRMLKDAETHAGEDVPIYATGARAALFHGVREQHYIYHAMVEAFGWTRGGVPVE